MRMDGETVHIQEIETVADRKGKLMRVDFEQVTANYNVASARFTNGDSAVILPYDPQRDTVLLARQLRLPNSFAMAPRELWRRARESSMVIQPNRASLRRWRKNSVTELRKCIDCSNSM